jgi:hypothetical protein
LSPVIRVIVSADPLVATDPPVAAGRACGAVAPAVLVAVSVTATASASPVLTHPVAAT